MISRLLYVSLPFITLSTLYGMEPGLKKCTDKSFKSHAVTNAIMRATTPKAIRTQLLREKQKNNPTIKIARSICCPLCDKKFKAGVDSTLLYKLLKMHLTCTHKSDKSHASKLIANLYNKDMFEERIEESTK